MKKLEWRGMQGILGGLLVALTASGLAFGHCDTMDGPVITDAKAALKAGDATPVLKWVPKADEVEIRSAFKKAVAVRDASPEARELADHYFFETLVRIHRAGEGAPYTGLKPAGGEEIDPIVKSDQALESGDVDDLARQLGEAVEATVRKRFAAAAEAKEHGNDSVEAGRKYVAAYVEFVHYVEGVHELTTGHADHQHGQAQASRGHGSSGGDHSKHGH